MMDTLLRKQQGMNWKNISITEKLTAGFLSRPRLTIGDVFTELDLQIALRLIGSWSSRGQMAQLNSETRLTNIVMRVQFGVASRFLTKKKL